MLDAAAESGCAEGHWRPSQSPASTKARGGVPLCLLTMKFLRYLGNSQVPAPNWHVHTYRAAGDTCCCCCHCRRRLGAGGAPVLSAGGSSAWLLGHRRHQRRRHRRVRMEGQGVVGRRGGEGLRDRPYRKIHHLQQFFITAALLPGTVSHIPRNVRFLLLLPCLPYLLP